MTIKSLAEWTGPEIDTECRKVYRAYEAEMVLHYSRYFSAHPELAGIHPYSSSSLETALPPGWASLGTKLESKTLHRYHRSAKSSQILALALLGVASERDCSLRWLWNAIGKNEELSGRRAEVRFEWPISKDLLNEEPRVTAIDYLVTTPSLVVCAEVKWTEQGLGQCSCSRDQQVCEDAAAEDAPAFADCSKRVLARTKYWETAAQIFGLPPRSLDRYCPISTSYQAIRNVAAARALANGRGAVFLLIYDARNPYFAGCGKWPGWPILLKSTLKDREDFFFREISWQRLVPLLPLDEPTRTWTKEKHLLGS